MDRSTYQDWDFNLRKKKRELNDKRTKINELIAARLVLKYHFEIQYRLEETTMGIGNVNVVVAKNPDGSLAEGVAHGDIARGQEYADAAARRTSTLPEVPPPGGGGGGAAAEQKEPYKSRGTAKGIKIQLIIQRATIHRLQEEFDRIQDQIDAILDEQHHSPEAGAFLAAAAAGAAAGDAAAAAGGGGGGGGGGAAVAVSAAEAAGKAAGAFAAQSALNAGKSKSDIILDAGLAAKSAAMASGTKLGSRIDDLIPLAVRASDDAKIEAEKVARAAGRQ